MTTIYLLYGYRDGWSWGEAAHRSREFDEEDKFIREQEVCGPNNDIIFFIKEVEIND